jgi:hypothetical protein
MADVRLQRSMRVPPVPAFEALHEVLQGIAAQEGPWRGFALHVSLGDLHLPDVGYVSVPIALTVGKLSPETPHALEITFKARRHEQSFPTFRGSAGVDATGPSASILWLAGSYDVPFQLFGKLFDATLAAGMAERTLENLIDDLADASTARTDQREAEFVRYRFYGTRM